MRTGYCLCEKIRFEFDTKPADVSFCHCSVCRRMTGSAFGAYFEVADAALRLVTGADLISSYKVTAKLEKQFCASCGSGLFARHSDFPGSIFVFPGAIPDTADIKPEYHEFVGSKAGWHEIGDSLPQFEKAAD